MAVITGSSTADVIHGNETTGLSLNDGATNQYAEIANFTDMPTSALTVEMRVTGVPPAHNQALLSYATSGSNNEFLIWHSSSSNTIHFFINGATINSGIPSSSLLSTEPHQISVSWDSATGAIEAYIDGENEFSGTFQTGAPISSGGTLNFGQEQDTVGGSFDPNQIFEGIINEVRIYDDIRTPAEIAEAANHQLADPANEAGLVANWQMDNVGTSDIVDESGNGNDLTLNNGAKVIELFDGTGEDTIYGDDGNDEIHGLSGNDDLFGNDGDDTLLGGDGYDFILGGQGNDSIEGGADDDLIYGDGEAGLSLNDGATDQYAQVENFSGMPTDALTIEMILTGDPQTHSQTLFSYAVDDGTNSHNEIMLWDDEATGKLAIHINNTRLDTAVDTSTFLDGTPHQFSLSWDSTTGNFIVYVDGVSVDSGVLEAGNPITSGGSLVLGQDQDSLGGAFDPNQVFDGVVNDLRIFDDVRTPEEIADNASYRIQDPASEPGLVANWQMSPVGASPILDATGSGNGMVLHNGAEVTDLANPGGDDTISGGDGNDEILGGEGNDLITGDDGNDIISGNAGSDTLHGGVGDDTLKGGAGADTMTGGDDRDVFYAEGSDNIDGGTGGDDVDTLHLGSDPWRLTGVTADADGDSTSGTVEFLDGFGNVIDTTTFAEIEEIICFASGTLIATKRGHVPVEELQIGDMVVTMDHGLKPIRWKGQRTVSGTGKYAPVRIKAGTLGNARDLLVSQQHKMLLRSSRSTVLFGSSEVLASAKHLVNRRDTLIAESDLVTWHHFLFDQHEIVFAEGAPSESYFPGNQGLNAIDDNQREELFSLFPELRSNPNGYGEAARMFLKGHEAKLIAA